MPSWRASIYCFKSKWLGPSRSCMLIKEFNTLRNLKSYLPSLKSWGCLTNSRMCIQQAGQCCMKSAPAGQLGGRAGRKCTLEDGERILERAIQVSLLFAVIYVFFPNSMHTCVSTICLIFYFGFFRSFFRLHPSLPHLELWQDSWCGPWAYAFIFW